MTWLALGKIGKVKIRRRNPFSTYRRETNRNAQGTSISKNAVKRIILNNERDIVHDDAQGIGSTGKSSPIRLAGKQETSQSGGTEGNIEYKVKARNVIERSAYSILSRRLPKLPGYREAFEQSDISMIYESYLSTGLLLSCIASVPTFVVSLLLELKLIQGASLTLSIFGSLILGGTIFAVALLLWLIYPLQRRKTFKSRLENQLAYSFGVIGALSAAGMHVDRLFESLAASESNPVVAVLARRFLRNIRLFGLDSESALKEVAGHSPSQAFAKMLNSMAVALKTTGSFHNLVVFESSRLLEQKRGALKKTTGNLAVMAELYITLVVVGPIIFIVMLSIFGLLPSGGLPNPILLINVIVFLGIPSLSVVVLILLDAVAGKTNT